MYILYKNYKDEEQNNNEINEVEENFDKPVEFQLSGENL